MEAESEARSRLIRDIIYGFDLSEDEASELADVIKDNEVMAKTLHYEFSTEAAYRKPGLQPLAVQLASSLQRQDVPAKWATLLPERIRPGVRRLYYVVRVNEIWGRWEVFFD